ncbi:hypothetical protein [Haloarcula argentinensis]|uniref:Helix-hairpin-helix domain-containing protein n=1 Tax=Haloarcula argentinensis TaxID=43776 RepID=A0A847UQ63_HALAR|nr:hypothetical protein [Haloarcula argentinensis]NLV14351.1 hypothetical protein [Haloarcula argentinensis]
MVDLLLVGPIALGFVAGYLARGIQTRNDGPDEIGAFLDEREAELRQRYETTEMDYVEFGERIAVFEDPETERIMRDAVDVDRIGPKTAFRIAQWFDGWEDYRDADQDAYEDVNGIGPNKGRALARRH